VIGDLARLAPALVIGVVVLTRVSMLGRGGSSRALWIAMAFLAAALTLAADPVYGWFNTLFQTSVGGAIAKLWFALGAAASVRMLCTAVSGQNRSTALRDWLLAAGTALVVAAPLVGWPPKHLSPLVTHSAGFYDSTWRSWVHWLPFLAYLSWALGSGVLVCWRYGRQATASPVRTGLTLIGTGCAAGFGVVGVKLAVLVAWHVGAEDRAWMKFNATGETTLLIFCCGLIAAGSSWEVLSAWLNVRRETWWARWSYWRLRPLWKALVRLYPTIVLQAAQSGGAPRFRLLRRVVEIRDGTLTLADELDPKMVSEVRKMAAKRTGTGPEETDAIVVAVAVRWAGLCRDSAGMVHPPTAAVAELPVGASGDLVEEVRWLMNVQRQYRSRQWSTLAATFGTPRKPASRRESRVT
jgi:hypothetical protein